MFLIKTIVKYFKTEISMKRQLFLRWMMTFVFIVTVSSLNAQKRWGVVADPDGYTNIRKGPGLNYPITQRWSAGEDIWYVDSSNGWCKVYKPSYSSSVFLGYMAKNRIFTTPRFQGTVENSWLYESASSNSRKKRKLYNETINFTVYNKSFHKVYNKYMQFVGYVRCNDVWSPAFDDTDEEFYYNNIVQ